MVDNLRTTCEGCYFLSTVHDGPETRFAIMGYECFHPTLRPWKTIGPRPETPDWCPLEEK